MNTIADAMQLVRDDCQANAHALNSKPLNGDSVVGQVATMLAMIEVLASAVQVLDRRTGA